MKKLIIDMTQCIHCDICVDYCIAKSISKTNNVYSVNMETCKGCKACIQMCPAKAISEE